MRAANLVLFLGTIGFINIYEDLMGEDDTGKLDPSDAKRLQRKFGVKEKRSAVANRAADGGAAGAGSAHFFDDYTEQLVEYLKRPVFRGLSDCAKADGEACNCLKLICFGQAECRHNFTTSAGTAEPPQPTHSDGAKPLPPGDPRYAYYAAGKRLRARRRDAHKPMQAAEGGGGGGFLRCRQTTIDPYVLCECKAYTRTTA